MTIFAPTFRLLWLGLVATLAAEDTSTALVETKDIGIYKKQRQMAPNAKPGRLRTCSSFPEVKILVQTFFPRYLAQFFHCQVHLDRTKQR